MSKELVACNYRPIVFLPLMWKLTSGILAEKLWSYAC